MTKTLENFIKNLKKLDDYYILREESEYFVMGTTVTFKEYREIHTTFSTYTSNLDKELPVFFVITFVKNESKIIKEFKKRNYPILNYTNCNIKNLKQSLDEFINKL